MSNGRNLSIRYKLSFPEYLHQRGRVEHLCLFIYFFGLGPSEVKVKVKSAYKPSGPSGRSLSRFPKHEETRILLLPPGWDASLSQGKMSCLRTQRSAPASARTWTAQSRVERTNH